MTLPSSLSIHIKMPWICFIGEDVPITIRVENHSNTPHPSEEDEYLIVEAWDEMVKYYPGSRGYTTLNICFSEPFKLAPNESKEIKWYFALLERSQYRIRANLNLVKIVKIEGDPEWEKHRVGRLLDKYGRTARLEFEGGSVIVEVLDIKEVIKKKGCTSKHDLILILSSITAALTGILLLLLQLFK